MLAMGCVGWGGIKGDPEVCGLNKWGDCGARARGQDGWGGGSRGERRRSASLGCVTLGGLAGPLVGVALLLAGGLGARILSNRVGASQDARKVSCLWVYWPR